MKKLLLFIFLAFGINFGCFAANNATDVYLLAQANSVDDLKSVGNIDVVDSDGNTALCSAIKYNDIDAYNILKKAGANTEHKCIKKIPKEQYQAFIQKVAIASKPWSFLGLGKYAWGAIGAGVAVGAGAAALSGGGGSNGESNGTGTNTGDQNTTLSCQEQGYTYKYSDSCPDGWIKNSNDYCNMDDGTGVWFKCDIQQTCSENYRTECGNGYEEVPGDICLSGTTVYKRCINATCSGFNYSETQGCPEGWEQGESCLSGTVMKYKCDIPATCDGYQASCGTGFLVAYGDTCKSGNNILVTCVFDSENYVILNGSIYPKLNCVNGTQTGSTCSCDNGWTGDLCDTPATCDGYVSSCSTGYNISGTCQSGNNTLVQCEFDNENYVMQGGIIYEKLNCVNGNQVATSCTCNNGWEGNLCNTPATCDGYVSSCSMGYNISSTCQSGNNTLVQCEFDNTNYIMQGGIVYPKLNCVNGTQTGSTCSCTDGWIGILCDTPATCSGYQTSCDTGYLLVSGDTCQSGDNTLVKCVFDNENFVIQGGVVYPKLNCVNGTQTGNTCSCTAGWDGDLCNTPATCDGYVSSCSMGYNISSTCQSGNNTLVQCEFDNEHYVIQGGIVYPKLNCANGNQIANTCSCTEGWTGNLCDIPAACDGYVSSCDTGYLLISGDTCQSGNDLLVKCVFDNENYIIQGGVVYPKLNCVNGTQTGNTCSCTDGWTGDLCDTPATCNYRTTECTGGFVATGRTCQSGTNTYVECEYIQCLPGQAWTPSGCVTQYDIVINNTTSTSQVLGRYNYANAANVSASINITNSKSYKVDAVFADMLNQNAINVISTTYDNTVIPNERVIGAIHITNSTDGEIYGVFSDEDSGDAINVYYDQANLNNVELDLNGTISITDSGNTGEVVGMNGRNDSKIVANLYIDQSGTNENWMSANILALVDITNHGDKPAYGIRGFNLYNAYSRYEISTTVSESAHGVIRIINEGAGNAYGMCLKYTNNGSNIAINAHNTDGTIEMWNMGTGNTYGMYGMNMNSSSLINLDISGQSDNSGIITLYNYDEGNIFGMYGSIISNEQASNGISLIQLQNLNSGQAVGVYATNTVNNSGTININNISTGTAIGIFGNVGSTITNSGVINITRNDYMDEDEVLHMPSGTSGDVFGIYAKSGSSVTNSGNINITTNGNAYGIYAESGSTVTNTGTISINGVSCDNSTCDGSSTYNNHIVLNGSTLYNSGLMMAPQMNLNSMGGNVVAGLGSQFVVDNELSGDLNISSDIVQSGNQTTYIAENMIDAGDVSGLNVRSASAMFDASLADNGHDVVMQMKDFDSLTDNKSLAAFLADNYAHGNGMDLFSTLKSMDTSAAFTNALGGLTGLNTFTQFAHEDLSAMREISFSMNNKLFENSGRDSFDISDSTGYFSFSNSHNGGSGQYGISSDKISDNWKLGYGMAMANINTGDGDDMHRQNKMWLFYMPATYTNDEYELVIAPKAGFANSEYSRRGYNNMNYEGYIEKRIFGLMNDLRYPLNFGNWTLAPDLAFNAIVYDQSGNEDGQEFSLVIPDDRTVSVETGFGLYTKYEQTFESGARLKLNSGLMAYREFGDMYNIKLGIRGMDGTFNLYNNDYTYRGAASFGFDYMAGKFHLYGNAQYFMDNDNYMNFKGGVSYRF